MMQNIKKSDDCWEGFIVLEKWNDLYDEELNIDLNIGGESKVDEVSSVYEEGCNNFVLNQEKILYAIFDAIFKVYSDWQEEYGYDEDEQAEFMPNLSKSIELLKFLHPKRIFILDTFIEKTPYIGIQFECSWDTEHGLGVMLLSDSVVKLGGSETAFMTWIAEEDKEERK